MWGNDPNNPVSPPTIDQNGLWKINTDGSGKTRISTLNDGDVIQFNGQGYTPWSIVSRDSQQYALVIRNVKGSTAFSVVIGSLTGGTTTTVETPLSARDQLTMIVAGWTTL